MNTTIKKTLTICIPLFLLLSGNITLGDSNIHTNLSEDRPYEIDEELVLLRGDHYLEIQTNENVPSFHIQYAFPPDYGYQIPVLFELENDTTAEILHHKIINDIYEPNKLINFTIGSINAGEKVLLHFYFWVLVKNEQYNDFPNFVRIPKKENLPENTIKWLTSTEVVQKDRLLIKMRSWQLRGLSNNLIRLAERIAAFTRWHRYGIYLFQLYTGLFGSQDAFTALLRNGECPGRSHLGVALFRAQNIPARVLMATVQNTFWYQMHWMTEYYLPGYGWVLTDVHKASTPHEPKKQIIMRICHPWDENNTRTDYIFKRMNAIENWFWIDHEAVTPVYIDCDEGSKCNMVNKHEILTDEFTAGYAMYLTKMVFHQYQQYLGMNLSGNNLLHFQNATEYQKQAISKFLSNDLPDQFILFIEKAYDEYKQINI